MVFFIYAVTQQVGCLALACTCYVTLYEFLNLFLCV